MRNGHCRMVILSAAVSFAAFAQQVPGPADRINGTGKEPPFGLDVPQDHRPGLFYREDFKGPPQGIHEMPVTQEFIANSNLQLKLYGPGGIHVQIDHHEGEPISPGLAASAGARNRLAFTRCVPS